MHFEHVDDDDWPKLNFIPAAHINLQTKVFEERLGYHFKSDIDDFNEYEYLNLCYVKEEVRIYLSLFRYPSLEQGVNILLDMSMDNLQKVVKEIIVDLAISDDLVAITDFGN